MAMQPQLPSIATSIFILLQILAMLPFGALGNLPRYSSDLLTLPTGPGASANTEESLHRWQFPRDFIFGVGTSAYQVEGAVSEGGKGISIWDEWTHVPGTTHNGQTGDVAVDHYNRCEEDINLIADMNMDSYRFSISWTRIFPMVVCTVGDSCSNPPGRNGSNLTCCGSFGLPPGKASTPQNQIHLPYYTYPRSSIHYGTGPDVNAEGVAHYNRVIDALVRKGLKPFVTLFHWDLPQTLQESYGGWLSHQSVIDFAAYAEACFAAFGDRVKHWVTFNEPGQFTHGYGGSSRAPPGRHGNPSTEPYIAAHNILLAHAAAVDVYRRLFKAEQKGEIGFTVDCEWGESLTNSTEDIEAAHRHVVFQIGWFLDPLYFGDYPAVMRELVGSRLPQFSPHQVSLIKGSVDFIGLNYYTSRWVTAGPGPSPNEEASVSLDQHVTTLSVKDDLDIGPQAASAWLLVVPWGMRNILKWTWERYDAPIFITENGMDYSSDLNMEDLLHDTTRVQFHHDYISSLLQAVREGVDVRGYYAWSLTDSFEWMWGYERRYGLIYIDYTDNLKRYPKDSARWFAQFLQRTRLDT